MKKSGDRVIGRSGDPTPARATPALSGDPGDRKPNLTTETRRHGGSGKINAFTAEALSRGEAFASRGCTEMCGTGTPACAEASFSGKQAPAGVPVPHEFRKLLHLVLATLREIFDENAYERFLQRTDSVRSVESYGAFLREKEAVTARKPRCC